MQDVVSRSQLLHLLQLNGFVQRQRHRRCMLRCPCVPRSGHFIADCRADCMAICRLHGNLHGHLVQLDRGCHLRRRHALVVQELQVAQLSEDGAAV